MFFFFYYEIPLILVTILPNKLFFINSYSQIDFCQPKQLQL